MNTARQTREELDEKLVKAVLRRILGAVKRQQGVLLEEKLPGSRSLAELKAVLLGAINPPPPEPQEPLRPEDDVRLDRHESFGLVTVVRCGDDGFIKEVERASSQQQLDNFLAQGFHVYGERVYGEPSK